VPSTAATIHARAPADSASAGVAHTSSQKLQLATKNRIVNDR
jgi:hypothetical protein